MPVVTVPESPSGEPTATTACPWRSWSESPRTAGCRPLVPLARTTAMSAAGAAPTSVTGATRPSEKTACRPLPRPAARTWLLVMIRPSGEMMTPEPSPAAPRICTVLGSTVAAIASTEPAGAGGNGSPAESVVASEVPEVEPPRRASPRSPRRSAPRRAPRGRPGSARSAPPRPRRPGRAAAAGRRARAATPRSRGPRPGRRADPGRARRPTRRRGRRGIRRAASPSCPRSSCRPWPEVLVVRPQP